MSFMGFPTQSGVGLDFETGVIVMLEFAAKGLPQGIIDECNIVLKKSAEKMGLPGFGID